MWWNRVPSNNRDWAPEQALLAWAEFHPDAVTIHHVRNFRYRSEQDFDVAYYDRRYDLRALKRLWLLIEPFGWIWGEAHTLVSFEFDDGTTVAISVEIRKQKGWKFSAWRDFFNADELQYVIGDERDLIALRTNYRKDTVYFYPIKATRAFVRDYFVSMLTRANALRENPEFYNTLANTCAGNLMAHAELLAPHKVARGIYSLLPGHAEKYLGRRGLIDSELPIEELRTHFCITSRAQAYGDGDGFSQAIRVGL